MASRALTTSPVNGQVVTDAERLVELESVVQHGYLAVGAALGEIRDRRLYRVTHDRFEDYCRERWDCTRQWANRRIEVAAYVATLEPNVSIPVNAHQAHLAMRAAAAERLLAAAATNAEPPNPEPEPVGPPPPPPAKPAPVYATAAQWRATDTPDFPMFSRSQVKAAAAEAGVPVKLADAMLAILASQAAARDAAAAARDYHRAGTTAAHRAAGGAASPGQSFHPPRSF
jgi:hypothetical protein